MQSYLLILSLVVFLPAAAALAIPLIGAAFPAFKDDLVKMYSLAVALVVFAITAWMAVPAESPESAQFYLDAAGRMQNVFSVPWIDALGVQYFMGMDGISFPLVLLTSFLSVLALGASWPIKKHVKAYCMLFLMLETGMLGVFLALDFFLFYVFWEVMLLPMYFLIGVWGGPRREYAAIKFFLYTLLGSVCMLIAIVMLYFTSDLRELSVAQLQESHVVSPALSGDKLNQALQSIGYLDAEGDRGEAPVHTMNLLALQQIGQHTQQWSGPDGPSFLGKSVGWWSFVLLFVGFAIKVPSFPVHTWLPDAHVEAPTPISMILAGVLLKMGGYGLIRICFPICPEAAYDLSWIICCIGVVSMVYGAFAALAQKDFKRLVAYSSVSHMGYVVLGLGIWSASARNGYDADYWKMGASGAMFQMIAHGISSAGMFFIVGVVYDRVHHRNLNEFGGLFAKMPVYCALAWVLFLAGVGLPGLCGFIGEALVVLAVWKFSVVLAVISAFVVILTAGYILWAFQRVFLGPEYKGPHGEALTPSTLRERAIGVTLVVAAFVFGIFPNQTVLKYLEPSVSRTVDQLVDWQKVHDASAALADVDENESAGATRSIAQAEEIESTGP
jgi:NADH-quinone oxidoreductase subunit M